MTTIYPAQATLELRLRTQFNVAGPSSAHPLAEKILQQKWIVRKDTENGLLTTEEWRDVPLA